MFTHPARGPVLAFWKRFPNEDLHYLWRLWSEIEPNRKNSDALQDNTIAVKRT